MENTIPPGGCLQSEVRCHAAIDSSFERVSTRTTAMITSATRIRSATTTQPERRRCARMWANAHRRQRRKTSAKIDTNVCAYNAFGP